MPLPSFLKRARSERASLASAAEPASLDPGVIELARARARRRLIGAAILVAAAVIGLPLLFDSAPRSLPHDVGVEVVHGDGRVTAALPQPSPATTTEPTEDRVADARPPRAADSRDGEGPAPVPKAAEPKAPAPRASAPKATSLQPQEPKAEVPKPAAPVRAPASAQAAVGDGARAMALLEGKDARMLPASGGASAGAGRPAAAGGASAAVAQRFVVQIGAFADVGAAREARQKAEKLGLKTYTQVISNDGGRRIRVRVGPFDDRRGADQAAAKIRQAGLGAAVLTL